ncbi:MAG: DMT family transporter, partial [Oscillospiraceae bacterium]
MAVCATLWSTAGVFIKLIPWHPLVIGSLRSAIAGAVLWCFLRHAGCLRPIVNAATLKTGVLLGCTMTLFVLANKLTTAANAIVLQSANPIFVLLFCSIWYHQRCSRRDLTVVGIVLLGVTLFFLDGLSLSGTIGNLLALCTAVLLAGAFLCASGADSLFETMSGVFLGHLVAALLGLPFLFLEPPVLSTTSVLSILFLGIFQLGIPYVLFSYAARVCQPLAISLIGMLEPIFSPVWVALFVHEIPGPLALFGGV